MEMESVNMCKRVVDMEMRPAYRDWVWTEMRPAEMGGELMEME